MKSMNGDAVLSAKKKQVYELSVINRPIPSVGIFDEPTRCYKINKEWARIVMGFVSLLTQPELWQAAENDLYEPIQQILAFLAGSECGMDCAELLACLADLQSLIDIQQELNDLRDYIEYGDSTVVLDTTTVPDIFPPAEQLDNIGDLEYVGCDPDEIWGAINSLVDYIHKTNLDFLQNVAQATNLAAQIERAIAATPVIGWFPADEAAGLVDWYANEANGEYLATVDEALLQQTKCDLFCIATSGGRCGLNYLDLINYFSSHVPASAGQFVDTLSNLILFAITGTFSGDDYFYYMCYFQLAVAAIGEKFFNTRGRETYSIYMAAGKNSPDSDWMLFCDACVDAYYIEYDFTQSDHGFTSTNATWQAGIGWVGTPVHTGGGNYRARATITKSFDPDALPIGFGGGMVYDTWSNCGIESQQWTMIKDSLSVGFGQVGSIGTGDDIHITWNNSSSVPYTPVEFDAVSFDINPACCGCGGGKGNITKARIWLAPQSKMIGIPSTVYPQGLGPNGSGSLTYWE